MTDDVFLWVMVGLLVLVTLLAVLGPRIAEGGRHV